MSWWWLVLVAAVVVAIITYAGMRRSHASRGRKGNGEGDIYPMW